MITNKTRLLPLFEVRKMLGVSWTHMMEIVRSGELRVMQVSGERMGFEDIQEDTKGIRVHSDDLREYMESIRLN